MERIEEIQKRYNDRKYVVTIFGQDHLFAHTDIRHLLSLIETQRLTIDKQHVLLDKYETILNEQGYL